VEIQKNADSKC